jgi:hypothetical protein
MCLLNIIDFNFILFLEGIENKFLVEKTVLDNTMPKTGYHVHWSRYHIYCFLVMVNKFHASA